MRRILGFLVVGLLLCWAAPAFAGPPTLEIDVLSNRAEVISAGDALVAVDVPSGVSPAKVRVFDDGREVTSAFAVRPNGRFEGLVTGLALGPNVLSARAPGAKEARITITNHPNGGPVFSGPQVQPWVCQSTARPTRSATSRPATRTATRPPAASSATTTRTTRPPTSPRRRPTRARRSPTSSASRPATRTATSTRSRPVRPDQAVGRAWQPQDGFNHKLLITHGASCGIDHQSG